MEKCEGKLSTIAVHNYVHNYRRKKSARINQTEPPTRPPLYIFKDPIRFDKKVDPKRFRFGSRIDDSIYDREAYFKVKRIVSPEILELNNGMRIRLLGVKKIPGKIREAIEFIKEKTRGQKLFMKFDDIKYDEKNNLLCYLYLQNKTFLNAHLIKKGLADIDTALNYKHKPRFLKYQSQKRK